MRLTLKLFDERKDEIDFYFSVIAEAEKGTEHIKTADNIQLVKIMKSNLILMLYNLIEACIVSGMMQIYERIKDDGCTYNLAISEIKNIWSNYRIDEIYGPSSGRSVYEERVQQIIQDVISGSPLILSRSALGISGNLNAKNIKELCDRHRIRYRLSTKGEQLNTVRNKRNDLAHGDSSFGNCVNEMPLSELENIKAEVYQFVGDILNGMKTYYDEKQYLIT